MEIKIMKFNALDENAKFDSPSTMLYAWRLALGVSQADVAKNAGISNASISNFERGRVVTGRVQKAYHAALLAKANDIYAADYTMTYIIPLIEAIYTCALLKNASESEREKAKAWTDDRIEDAIRMSGVDGWNLGDVLRSVNDIYQELVK